MAPHESKPFYNLEGRESEHHVPPLAVTEGARGQLLLGGEYQGALSSARAVLKGWSGPLNEICLGRPLFSRFIALENSGGDTYPRRAARGLEKSAM